MKFKKTKLTALAMSVLMAASTITSVTWAADLFTDGAPAEVAVEAPVEVVSDVEEEVIAEDAALTGESVITAEFRWDKDKDGSELGTKVVAEVTIDGVALENDVVATVVKDSVVKGTCTEPEHALYVIDVEGVKVFSSDEGVTVGGDCKFDEKGYIIPSKAAMDAANGHIKGEKTGSYVIDSPDHENLGHGVYYDECIKCHQMLPDGFNKDIDYSGAKPEVIFAQYKGNPHAEGKDVVSYPPSSDTYTFNCEFYDIGKNVHNYGSPQVVYDKYVSGTHPDSTSLDGTPYATFLYGNNGKPYAVEDSGKEVSDFRPFKCHWENGEMVADNPEDEQDAFYFYVQVCKDCKTIKFSKKVYLKDTEGTIGSIYYVYVPEGNIKGFLGKNRLVKYEFDVDPTSSNYGKYVVNNADGTKTVLPGIPADLVSDPPEPVFEKCGLMGRYDVEKYETDTREPVLLDRVRVENNHSWGAVEVVPYGTTFIDGTKSELKTDDFLTNNNATKVPDTNVSYGKIVVVRDVNGNVTDVKTKDCMTTAKYQLGRKCSDCGVWEKEGDVKTAGPNKDIHNWGPWSNFTDPVDDKYYDLEDGTHKRFTYKHRTCSRCGERELKLDNEYVEAHNLVETKYDDEGEDETYVAPTCGKAGSYDVILRCKCGYEDKESRKTTTIPATDKHVFGDNPAELQIVGTVQVGGRTSSEPESKMPTHIIYAQVVRKCTVCGEYDSNGINNTPVNGTATKLGRDKDITLGPVGATVIVDSKVEGRTFSDYVPAKADPSTNVPYPCSVGKITVNFKWEGKVDGEAKRLTGSKTVPYYINDLAYQGARAHKADDVRIIDKVDATATQEGSYTKVVYCSVCHDEVSREKVTIAKLGSAPSVTAKAVDYNSVDIRWDAVEGASEYNLYYKSADTKITRWVLARVVKGTSFTHTGLQTGARYRYTVRAVVNGVLGAFDKTGSVARPMPTAPVMKSVTAQGKKTIVSWSKAEGATGYIVFRKTPTGSWTRVGTVKSGKVSWTDKKPVSGSTYKVRSYRTVKGVNYKSGFSDVK